MAVEKKVLKRAWREASSKKTMLIEKRPVKKGELNEYRAVKTGKMLILHAETPSTKNLIAVAFPKMEHMELFRDAAKEVKKGGPAQFNPGAIGTVNLKFLKGTNPPVYERNYAQAHFMTKGNPGLKNRERGLERKWATYYGGWRVRCIGQLMQEIQKRNSCVFVKTYAGLSGKELPEQELRDFDAACAGLGLRRRRKTVTYKKPGETAIRKAVIMAYSDSKGIRLIMGEPLAFYEYMLKPRKS